VKTNQQITLSMRVDSKTSGAISPIFPLFLSAGLVDFFMDRSPFAV
jgi:hypothetical protein